ncbi:endogenous retrovirus group K member 18 Env polyprotein-like isoform X2 [Neomonachus schauinslandi]|nr:endogenous retrovirus group K member 18 Env polyprotein-like [Neomonachus schauinslandi]XP_044768246.1 endogenous retrovirus group K member 18 Env polyprotein-like isoform X2 [Neomonachus schauinslandi]
MDRFALGSPRDGSSHGPIRTVPYRRRDRAPGPDLPLQAMAHLSLGPCRRRHTFAITFPTWGQIKKLSGEGQNLLQRTGKAHSPENLFLAMCALLTVSSSAEVTNVSYWAYIPNPPMMEPTPWGSADISVYTVPPILSPPWKNFTSLNRDDGAPFNFSYKGDGPYICLGPSPCLEMNWQNWILPGNSTLTSRTQLQRLEAWSLNMTWEDVTFVEFPSLPTCPDFTYREHGYKPFVWQECVGRFAKRYKDFIMWGPYGQFFTNCSEWNKTYCSPLLSHRIPSRKSRTLKSQTEIIQSDRLMAWGDGEIADPRIAHRKFPDHIQTHLWKIAAALRPIRLYQGQYVGTSRSPSNYTSSSFKETNITACVPLPYLFLVGKLNFNNGISCINCQLYSCLNTSVSVGSDHVIMILQQRSHIWLPVNLERHWAQNPVDIFVMEFFKKILQRTKRFLGLVVATILSLITVTTLAAISGIALYTSLQTKHFVEIWHQDSRDLWLSQTMIDTRLQTQIDVLKQTVSWLGKKVLTLERQIWLHCDWNSTTFCVTNLKYNESQHEWSIVQNYLEGNSSAIDMINNLQTNVQEVFGKSFQTEDAANLADIFLKNLDKHLEGLDPKGIIQSLGHTAGGIGLVLLIIMVCLILLYFCHLRPTRSSLVTLWKAMLLQQKKKEGIEVAQVG